jgi:signal peptidase I
VLTLAIALGLAFAVQAYAVKPYKIPSGSMEPTLHIGDRVLVNRLSRHLGSDPKIGQITVFHPPSGADSSPAVCGAPPPSSTTPCAQPTATESSQTFIKRVVAIAGDRISVRDGQVIRNGVPEPDPFAAKCEPGDGCNFASTITVPPGDVYLMGDNRGDSDDSRYWGPEPIRWIIGHAIFRYWPPGRIGTP